jgi:hypothetical protein
MDFVPLILEGFDQIHPEIENIPGRVQHYSNSHEGFRLKQDSL